MTTPANLANKIIAIGEYCKSTGVSNVFISSLLVTANFRHTQLIRQINDILKTLCVQHGFIYIDNDNISQNFLFEDGIHLVNAGRNILANNIIRALNFKFSSCHLPAFRPPC